MARQMRAFSLDVEGMAAVDRLVAQATDSVELQTLFAVQPTNEEPDEYFLRPADYARVYALLKVPAKDPKHWATHVSERRAPVWKNLQLAIDKEEDREALQKIVIACQKRNRGLAPARHNASRIVDALLNLGFETLKEKVASLESERSKRPNAGKGKDKLSVSSRRTKA